MNKNIGMKVIREKINQRIMAYKDLFNISKLWKVIFNFQDNNTIHLMNCSTYSNNYPT